MPYSSAPSLKDSTSRGVPRTLAWAAAACDRAWDFCRVTALKKTLLRAARWQPMGSWEVPARRRVGRMPLIEPYHPVRSVSGDRPAGEGLNSRQASVQFRRLSAARAVVSALRQFGP